MDKFFPQLSDQQEADLALFHKEWRPVDISANGVSFVAELQRWTATGFGPKEIVILAHASSSSKYDDGSYSYKFEPGSSMAYIMRSGELTNSVSIPIGEKDRVRIICASDMWFKENKDVVGFFLNYKHRDGEADIDMFRAGEYIKSLNKPIKELTEMDRNNAFAYDIAWRHAYSILYKVIKENIPETQLKLGEELYVSHAAAHFLVDNGMDWMPYRADDAMAELEANIRW